MIWENTLAAVGTLVLGCMLIAALTVYECVKAVVSGRVSRARIACGVPEPENDRNHVTNAEWWPRGDMEVQYANLDECPYCRNATVEKVGYEQVGDIVHIACRCSECGREWRNEFDYCTTLLAGGRDE